MSLIFSKDELEMQQEEENLPYEEEIYKDSSTFLKVNKFSYYKSSHFSSMHEKILNTIFNIFQFLRNYHYKIKILKLFLK